MPTDKHTLFIQSVSISRALSVYNSPYSCSSWYQWLPVSPHRSAFLHPRIHARTIWSGYTDTRSIVWCVLSGNRRLRWIRSMAAATLPVRRSWLSALPSGSFSQCRRCAPRGKDPCAFPGDCRAAVRNIQGSHKVSQKGIYSGWAGVVSPARMRTAIGGIVWTFLIRRDKEQWKTLTLLDSSSSSFLLCLWFQDRSLGYLLHSLFQTSKSFTTRPSIS